MDILEALKQEESKLRRQLAAVQGAISALNGGHKTSVAMRTYGSKRALSAAGRANIIRAAKARWAKIRAEKTKKKN